MIRYVPQEVDDTVNVSPRSPLREAVVLLGGLASIALVLYIAAGMLIDTVAQRMSPTVERAIGEHLARSLASRPRQMQRTAQVQEILDALAVFAPDTGLRYRVHVVSVPDVNAVALPGGHLVVSAPLLEYVSSENALAFVLAHELGHFVHRDHLRGAGRVLVAVALSAALLGTDSGVTQALARPIAAAEMRFSQAQEVRADLFALELLVRRYGHVGGALEFLQRVAAAERSPRWAYLFATHPFPADRIRRLSEEIRQREYAAGPVLPLQWDDVSGKWTGKACPRRDALGGENRCTGGAR